MTADEFRTIRKGCGFSQPELAAWLRVSPALVQSIEQGRRSADGPVALLMEMLRDGKV